MIKSNQRNQLLLDIIEKNKDTEYGRKYHFDYIRTVDGFRFNVPLTKYEDVQPLVELTTRIGEERIYTQDKLTSYALTSGTSEINHYVPCTRKHISAYVDEFLKLLRSGRGDKVVLFSSIPQQIIYYDQAKLDTISGAVLKQIQPDIKRYHITSPEALLFPMDTEDMIYYRTLFALRSAKVDAILAPFAWNVMAMVQCILDRHAELCHDLKTGKITFDHRASDRQKEALQAAFAAAPKRAAQLDRIFEAGNTDGLLTKLWPGLRRVVAAGTGRFEVYRDNLAPYLGGASYSNGLFAASEAILGIAVPGREDYRMYDKNAYLEFRPMDDSAAGTVLSDEVEIGKAYAVYVTNYAGLYRYRVGDIVRITAMEDGIPYFDYVGRTNEKISEQKIYHALKAVTTQAGISLNDFCFEKKGDGTLIVYLETQEPEKADGEALAKAFPKELCVSEVKTIPCGTQYRYKCLRGVYGNMASDQLKPVRFLDSDEEKDFFDLFSDAASD